MHRIYSLATRLDGFRNDTVIQNDRKTALDSITQLNKRANASTDPSLRAEITDTIARRQDQLDNLNKLFNTMERADLQLENTLTSLGTVYSQVLLIDASDVNSSKTQRLRDSISEQVSGLQDVISSMDEVYGSSQDQLAQASKNMARK